MSACYARVSPMPSSFSIRTASDRWKRASPRWPTSFITTSLARRPSALNDCVFSPAISRRASAPIRPRQIAQRCSPKRTWSPIWSANSPNYKARWDVTTRSTTAKRPRSPTRSRSTIGLGLPATRCPKDRLRRRSRSPTSWKRWPVCSASGRRQPGTRILSVCAGRRSVCCG